ncbi:MAG: SWIM zinc finger family protein [Fibrobacterota bacterium]|nr:SWIM zinc finger family protein [Fibrobacterota bacterium]QQS06031.1 MAG: SWIM zinc finger family protein [Fibrobacterota bacterium]
MSLTVESVLDLAPDPGSAKAGRDLAKVSKWTLLQRDDRALWGLCPGSGKDPYQTRIDLSGPAFKCSCPSRKFPCKHGLGLLLAHVEHPEAFGAATQPGWVSEWIAGRDQREERKVAPKPADSQPDPAAREKRQAARDAKVDAGIADLSARLDDLLGQGLSWARDQSPAYWEGMAARMVDAQAPGLAREVRELGELVHAGSDWASRMAEKIGRIHLLLEAGARRTSLSAPVRSALEARLGFPVRESDLLEGETTSDDWHVLGRRTGEDEGIRWRRTWLRGEKSGRFALMVAFAGGREPLDPGPGVGARLRADAHWQSAPLPRRAVLSRPEPLPESDIPGGFLGFRNALEHTASEIALDPLQERFPWLVESITFEPCADGFSARDAQGLALPLSVGDLAAWRLVAGAAGRPAPLFAEWDGQILTPLAVFLPEPWTFP